jgi:DNA-binding response OmpR family regulator
MTRNNHSSGLTILMVENEEDTACLLEFVLQKNGYRVIHSNNGIHAKSLISTMEPPNAVLLDTALPDTNGLDILAYLRAQTNWQNTAVALLTTATENVDMRQAALLGANDSILKPVSPTRLVTRLNRLLRDSQKRQTRVA